MIFFTFFYGLVYCVWMANFFNGFVLYDILSSKEDPVNIDVFKNLIKGHMKNRNFSSSFWNRALERVIASERLDAIEYFLTEVTKPDYTHLHTALHTRNPAVVNLVCQHALPVSINLALVGAVASAPIKFVNLLLDFGADPNHCELGGAVENAAARGHLKILRLLHARGGKLTPSALREACRWGHNDVAFWIYAKGVRCHESLYTQEFLDLKREKENEAQRKIYFWYMKRLMCNKEFIMKQAFKSYDKLFGVRECVSA